MTMQNKSLPDDVLPLGKWRKVPICVGYKVYVHPWPHMQAEQRQSIVESLGELGVREDSEICNVTTVRAYWGFLVVPPVGFPELRISFRPEVTSQAISKILTFIEQQITASIITIPIRRDT